MKILQVVHSFIDKTVGGTELYTYYLVKELVKRHEVAVFYYGKSDSAYISFNKGDYGGIPTYIVGIPTSDLYEWSKVNYRNSVIDDFFKKVILEFKPDIIHYQHLLYSSMNFPQIAKSQKIPSLHTLHDFYLICPCIKMIDHKLRRCENPSLFNCYLCCIRPYSTLNLFKRIVKDYSYCTKLLYHLLWRRKYFIKDRVFKNIDLFISPSNFLRNRFIQYGIPEGDIIFSDNGMNYNIIKAEVRNKNTDHEIVFGYIGNHDVVKGVPILISAFNDIKEGRLYIYGNGGEKKYGNMVKNNNINFKGPIDDQQKDSAFRGIDVLVVPSIWCENSPLVIHEAYMFKIPVITSDIGGMAELVKDGETGLHFRVGDIASLQEKIKYFIDNPGEINRMGNNTPTVKNIEDNAYEIECIYRNLLER